MSNMESGVYRVDRQGDVQHDVDLHVDTHSLPHTGHDGGHHQPLNQSVPLWRLEACSQVLQPASLHEQGGYPQEHLAHHKASCSHLKSEIALIFTDSLRQQHPHHGLARVPRDVVHSWVQQAHPQQGQGVRGGHGHGRGGKKFAARWFLMHTIMRKCRKHSV